MKEKERKIVGEFLSPDTIHLEILETFEYEYPGRDVDLNISTDEFTCVCPKSGLPDFATISIRYVPDLKCVELRSLKFYLMAYRQVGIFHEHVVNRILGDFVEVVEPIRVTVFGDFKIRGGLHTTSEVSWKKEKK